MTIYATYDCTGSNGSSLTGWTNVRQTTSATAQIQSNKERLHTGTVTAYAGRSSIRATTVGLVAESEILCKFTNTTTVDGGIEFWLRTPNATWDSQTGYFVLAQTGSTTFSIRKAVNYSYTTPNSNTYTLANAIAAQNVEWNVRIQATGTGATVTLKAKLWRTSDGEPGSWQISTTDTAGDRITAAGYMILEGKGGNSANCIWDIDDIALSDGVASQDAAGTIAATSAVSGAVTSKQNVTGTIAATSGLVGNATIISGPPPQQVSGTIAAVSGVSGSATNKVKAVFGTVAGTSTVAGTVTAKLMATGTVAAVSAVSGTVVARLQATGTVQALSGVSGALVVTGKPGQGNEILELFNPDEVLTGGRVTYYQFDLLNSQEQLVGQLQGVESGEVTIDAYSAVKGTGRLTVYTDPAYRSTPEGQPDFLGVQVTTLLGPVAVSTALVTDPVDHITCLDADAVDISIGDQAVLTDSANQPKESTVFTVVSKTASAGHTTLTFTPDANASIAIGDQLKVVSVSFTQQVDWLNARIRPMIRIQRLGGGDDPDGRLVPAGVFLCAAPVEAWTAIGLRREVELADKLSILDQDIASGDPAGIAAYAAPAGANVIDLVKTLIGETGELTPAIQPDSKVLASPMLWDVGTTRLRIINDLLDAGGYFSLFCDGYGQYQAVPYVQPSDRVPVYESLAPFSDGPQSLMAPEWTRDRDIYSIPNRYLVVGQGDGTTAALTSLATNTDPNSPYSYPSRGRWITEVAIGVEAVDQSALDTIARARLSSATSITNQITLQHIFLPDLHVNSVVHFVNPGSGLDLYCYVVHTTIPMDPLKLCTTVMRVVA